MHLKIKILLPETFVQWHLMELMQLYSIDWLISQVDVFVTQVFFSVIRDNRTQSVNGRLFVSRVSLVSLSAQLSITKTPKNSRHVLVLSFPPHTINAISEPHRSGLFNSAKQKVIPRQLKKQKCNWYETFIPTFA